MCERGQDDRDLERAAKTHAIGRAYGASAQMADKMAGASIGRSLSPLERLEERRRVLVTHLQRIDQLLALCRDNPGTVDAITAFEREGV
jgi:hypothetical protein